MDWLCNMPSTDIPAGLHGTRARVRSSCGRFRGRTQNAVQPKPPAYNGHTHPNPLKSLQADALQLSTDKAPVCLGQAEEVPELSL